MVALSQFDYLDHQRDREKERENVKIKAFHWHKDNFWMRDLPPERAKVKLRSPTDYIIVLQTSSY